MKIIVLITAQKYALTDPTSPDYDESCDHDHDVQCNRCYKLERVLADVKNAIQSSTLPEDEVQRLLYEFDIAKSDVGAWKAHILRTYNQESAKHDVLNSMDDKSIMLVMDWAMKF